MHLISKVQNPLKLCELQKTRVSRHCLFLPLGSDRRGRGRLAPLRPSALFRFSTWIWIFYSWNPPSWKRSPFINASVSGGTFSISWSFKSTHFPFSVMFYQFCAEISGIPICVVESELVSSNRHSRSEEARETGKIISWPYLLSKLWRKHSKQTDFVISFTKPGAPVE